MSSIQIKPFSKKLIGTIRVPGDKSISHRALFFGAISHGETHIHNLLAAEDVITTQRALQQLGVSIHTIDSVTIVNGQNGIHFLASSIPLELGNSGTTTRLLMGLLIKQNFDTLIKGDSSLSMRPMKRIISPLVKMGGKFEGKQDTLPLTIKSNQRLLPFVGTLEIASAQLKTALIYAALQAKGISEINEPIQSRDHTEKMLTYFGGTITRKNQVLLIEGQQQLTGQEVTIPGDFSSAAFFITAALLSKKSDVLIKQVGINKTRTGFLTIITRMGAKFELSEQHEINGEPVADITIKQSNLASTLIGGAEIPLVIDELPLVALLATQATGHTIIKDAKELRVKETDRIKVVVEELNKLGINIMELPDGMIIEGPQKLNFKSDILLDSHGDHRIGMMLTIAIGISEKTARLANAEAINISYPGFLTQLQELGGN